MKKMKIAFLILAICIVGMGLMIIKCPKLLYATDKYNDSFSIDTEQSRAQDNLQGTEFTSKKDVYNNLETVESEAVRVVNLKGDQKTIHKLENGEYIDNDKKLYIYNGKDAWREKETDVEWKEIAEE